MAAVVSFSSGAVWFVNSVGWARYAERTTARLAELVPHGPRAELMPFGVSFELTRDQIRLPLAHAMLAAAREVWRADPAGANGLHAHGLAELLEIEITTIERPIAVRFGPSVRWTAEPAVWHRVSEHIRRRLAPDLPAGWLRPHGVCVTVPDDEPVVAAALDAVRELGPQPLRRPDELADALAAHLAALRRPLRRIEFPDGTEWATSRACWERLAARAARLPADRPVGGLISPNGVAFAVMDEPTAAAARQALATAAEQLLADRTGSELDQADLRKLVDMTR